MKNKKPIIWKHNPEGQDWQTPKNEFDMLNEIFHFTVDCCASEDNALLEKYWTDCLSKNWKGERIFCNPPFSGLPGKILPKAREAELFLMILMLNQMTMKSVHENKPDYLIIPDHRIKFWKKESKSTPTFGACYLLYGALPKEIPNHWTIKTI